MHGGIQNVLKTNLIPFTKIVSKKCYSRHVKSFNFSWILTVASCSIQLSLISASSMSFSFGIFFIYGFVRGRFTTPGNRKKTKWKRKKKLSSDWEIMVRTWESFISRIFIALYPEATSWNLKFFFSFFPTQQYEDELYLKKLETAVTPESEKIKSNVSLVVASDFNCDDANTFSWDEEESRYFVFLVSRMIWMRRYSYEKELKKL